MKLYIFYLFFRVVSSWYYLNVTVFREDPYVF